MIKIQKLLRPNLDGIPEDKRIQALSEAGNYIVEQVLRYVERGVSPVEGEGKFDNLDKEYAQEEKQGRKVANLQASGAMMSSFDYEVTPNGLLVGIMSDDQQDKADGHNNFSGKSRLPRRRFVPDSKQSFDSKIMDEVENILDNYRLSEEPQREDLVVSSPSRKREDTGPIQEITPFEVDIDDSRSRSIESAPTPKIEVVKPVSVEIEVDQLLRRDDSLEALLNRIFKRGN